MTTTVDVSATGTIITRYDTPSDDVTYGVMFFADDSGTVTIVSGVMDWGSQRCVASNTTHYSGGHVYIS